MQHNNIIIWHASKKKRNTRLGALFFSENNWDPLSHYTVHHEAQQKKKKKKHPPSCWDSYKKFCMLCCTIKRNEKTNIPPSCIAINHLCNSSMEEKRSHPFGVKLETWAALLPVGEKSYLFCLPRGEIS